MSKFFVESHQINDNKIKIIGEDVNHIKNVLRLKPDDLIYVCDKTSHTNFLCSIQQIEENKIICKINEELKDTTEANTNIHIFQGLPKGEKMEYIIEKCTEIGVKEITPVIMKRTIVKLNEKDINKKIERWRKIAEVAAKQSGRDKILGVQNLLNFKNVFENLKKYDIVLVAYENEKNNTLKNVLKKLKDENKVLNLAVLIGPEGGIDINEIEELKNNISNVQIVTLGKRILRTETAPLVISSNILYELEKN